MSCTGSQAQAWQCRCGKLAGGLIESHARLAGDRWSVNFDAGRLLNVAADTTLAEAAPDAVDAGTDATSTNAAAIQPTRFFSAILRIYSPFDLLASTLSSMRRGRGEY